LTPKVEINIDLDSVMWVYISVLLKPVGFLLLLLLLQTTLHKMSTVSQKTY